MVDTNTKKEIETLIAEKRILIQYLRNPITKHPFGVIMGIKANFYGTHKLLIGWSICNTSRDVFNSSLGKTIAYNRAFAKGEMPITHSKLDEKVINNFIERCAKYFRFDKIANEANSDFIAELMAQWG